MKILLTNDDGYAAPGIQTLYKILCPHHDVVLAAPDREKSAVGHGISLNAPLRIDPISLMDGSKGYAITGTPADCVKLSLAQIFETPPDLVISGINPGSNTGININYSGTVGAAREARLNGILSMAVSIEHGRVLDYAGMARFVACLADQICVKGLPSGTFLNINAPAIPITEIRGIKMTRQASKNLSKEFDKRLDPKKRTYYWYGRLEPVEDEPDTDRDAITDRYISITPIQCDVTDYTTLGKLASMQFSRDDWEIHGNTK